MSPRKVRAAESELKMKVIENIPIVGVGTYHLSTGVTTFTEADLADAVKAANEDPAVKNPRLKLGHTDEGWQAGEPSFGNYFNLHLSENGQEILASLETLEWLADILPIAYPNRSIEGAFGYESSTGKFYRFVITAVSALGIELPGVSTLDDLREALLNPEVEVVADVVAASKPRVVVRAQVEAEDVRRQFYAEVAQGDRYWWWIRAVNLEPNEIIAEDEESGTLYKVPFTISDRDITFGEPGEVYVEYKDAPSEEPEPAMAKATIYREHKAARSRIKVKATEEEQMTPEELRASLGLPSDATDEQVTSKIAELRAAAEEQDPPNPDPDDTDGDDEDEEDDDNNDDDEAGAAGERTGEPATTTASTGAVTVDAEALASLQRDAAMGRKAREAQIEASERELLDEAIKAGKFPPARRGHFKKLLAADPSGTKQLIKDLADNVVPVAERGSQRVDDTTVDASADMPYDPNWLTAKERERIAAARGGQ